MAHEPVVKGYTVRPATFPEGHWMNRYWGTIVRAVLFFVRRASFFRHTLLAGKGARDLLSRGGPVIFACLHQDLIATCNALPRLFPRRRIAAITSLSRDGDLAATGLRALGYHVVRGSSTRGGNEALLALYACVRDGSSLFFVCDGPKAPLGDVKPGVVRLAALTGAPIVPVRSWAHAQLVSRRSWAKSALPVPGQTVGVFLGDPVEVPKDSGDPRPWQVRLARAFRDLAVRSSAWAGGPRRAPFTVAEG